MTSVAGILFHFPKEIDLISLLSPKFALDPELAKLAKKTVVAIAKFFAGKRVNQEEIATNLQTMAAEIKEEHLSEDILTKIERVFFHMGTVRSIRTSCITSSGD